MEQWLVGVWHEVSFTISDWLFATCKWRLDNNGSVNNTSRTGCCMRLAWSQITCPTMYEATSIFISDFDVVSTLWFCWKESFGCLLGVSFMLLHGSLATSFVCVCCLCRCFVKFGVVLAAVEGSFQHGQSVHLTVKLFSLCSTNSK